MKKTMRKSALLSSVAMLIVSAIVLTSATYAWFSAAKQVEVTELSAGVQSASGLQISADGTTYKSKISTAELASAGKGSIVPATGDMMPVSTVDTTSFVTGAFDDNDALSLKAPGTDTKPYYYAHVWLKAGAEMTVTMAGCEIDAGDAEDAVKFAVYDITNAKLLGIYSVDGSTDSWKGIGTEKDYTSADRNQAIVNDGTEITPVASLDSFELTLTANTAHELGVYMWLEGQDPDCTEAMANEAISCTLNFADKNAA